MDKMLVSVITPSLNQGQFIEQNILSVARQTYPLIEHIVIDGGSTDGTIEILRKHNDKIKWVSEPDQGFADACNKGIKVSKGEIINIQNADDYFCNAKSVAKAVSAFKSNLSAGLVFGDCIHVDEKEHLVWDGSGYGKQYSYERLICSKFIIPQGSAYFTRKAFDEVGEVNLSDMDFESFLWMKIGLKYSIGYIPEILSCYRIHKGQRTRHYRPKFRKKVVDEFFLDENLPEEVKELRKKAYDEASDFELSKILEYKQIFEYYKWVISYRYTRWLYPLFRWLYRLLYWR